eukprot:CAMPEP_0172609196 /NCGR_PEP_ID=MMETSP1068-20121228/29220_1 /TAXON_ID=35684 /ORGANISM="Pseudopedinella elastica, Strain CCMP716" /LENGTH=124 /DNA_ID=CAMNT_0013412667 /DNA_START=1 /DNA_END=372 /DNA_ORIENTATION=-
MSEEYTVLSTVARLRRRRHAATSVERSKPRAARETRGRKKHYPRRCAYGGSWVGRISNILFEGPEKYVLAPTVTPPGALEAPGAVVTVAEFPRCSLESGRQLVNIAVARFPGKMRWPAGGQAWF